MASATAGASGNERSSQFGALFKFQQVFHEEIAQINQRRALREDPRGAIELECEARDASGEWVWRPPEQASVVGLALSGGGIRSAAFCLGVLQALDTTKVLDRVDYMSTVSGGGYIGCSLTAAQEWSGQNGAPKFPFASRLEEDEPPALQHVRDHSNYLFPRGAIDFLHNASIYARGLIANAIIVAPFVLIGSVLTLLWYVLRVDQTPAWRTVLSLLDPYGLRHFFFTIDLALILIVVGIVWGIVQSTRRRRQQTEIPGAWTLLVGIVVIAFLVVVFCDLQPFVLDAMFRAGSGDISGVLAKRVNAISAVLAPIGAIIAFLASKLGEYVKSAFESPKWSTYIKGLAAKAAIYVGGLIVPLLIWVVYLDITYWGLCIDVRGLSCLPPAWLGTAAHAAFDWSGQPATALYLAAAIFLLILTLLMQPNANSLHPLYRDRLAKAFLFNPKRPPGRSDADLEEYRPRLSQITSLYGPYHLINTALNVQASKTANRRGRNADFFIFSPKFVGSKSTDYVATEDVEDVAIGLDLATAMAASGAAVSSNMGAQSIKPLTATLALLNIRLGYWLRNPLRVTKAGAAAGGPHFVTDFFRVRNVFANYYFLGEVFGRLSERRKSVYLTDGGHIENLGIYELLRRRCGVIIAVDAEADPQMAFGSFNALERYALIDLGVRIDLPWQQITDESLAIGEAIDSKSDAPKDKGPHCAIGEICYPGGRKGILVYIKASLTGDENDYVFDYKKRYGAFPHETTLDQWFSEEQFEAYRALGFHAAYRLFDRSDRFAHRDRQENPDVQSQIELLDRLFPRVETGGPHGQKQTLADWLPGDEGLRPGASGTGG